LLRCTTQYRAKRHSLILTLSRATKLMNKQTLHILHAYFSQVWELSSIIYSLLFLFYIFYYKEVHITQITSIGKMLKSSFTFWDSDQIPMSSLNVQTSLFRFFRFHQNFNRQPIGYNVTINTLHRVGMSNCVHFGDQIAMSSHNVQTSLFRFFRRDAAIWVDTINKI
jgi:hypothetical protein